MRRGLIVLLAAVCLLVAGAAVALNISASRPVIVHETASIFVAFVDSLESPNSLPQGYTINAEVDEAIQISRYYQDSGWETYWTLKAGQSILIPAPDPVRNSTSGYYRHHMRVIDHTGDVNILPWN